MAIFVVVEGMLCPPFQFNNARTRPFVFSVLAIHSLSRLVMLFDDDAGPVFSPSRLSTFRAAAAAAASPF